ncbi:MAG: ATP-binding protein [Cellulomonadaceae bacterium]|nr:ATP-binding protein [Cellulomonadaceae bacterium]
MRNPFTPRSLPLILAGRDADLSLIDQVLTPVAVTRQPAEGAVVLHGVRGIGKTSILRAAATRAASEQGLTAVWTSAAKGQSYLPALATSIRRTLESSGIVAPGTWSLDEIGVNLGPVKATARRNRQKPVPHPEFNVGAVEEMLRSASTLCAEHGGARGGGMLLLMDEMQAASRADLAILLNALQNISHDQQGAPPFAFVAAGLPSVRGAITSAATFGERTAFRSIKSLDQDATRLALVETARESGVSLSNEAIDLLWSTTQGYPFFVQLYGFHTWAAASLSKKKIITLADAQRGVATAQNDVNELFAARLSAAAKAERAMMTAIAQLGGDEPVKRLDLADALGKSTQSISSVRSQLIDKAVLTEEERGYIQFTLPGFAQYVLEQA